MTNKTRLESLYTSRLYFLDYLRAALVSLVVIHHVAMVYGAAAPFYYTEPPPLTQFRAFSGLLIFALFNQSFFMGALFLLAGYFVPRSFDRKGAGGFVRDKLLRLGIPLAVFMLLIHPVSGLGTYLMPVALTGLSNGPTWADYPGLIGLGPSWFIAMLLVFNCGYVVWRLIANRRTVIGTVPDAEGSSANVAASAELTDRASTLGSSIVLGVVAVSLAAASYLWRIVVPLGATVAGFPTLAYLPQYLGFFVAGIVASRRGWFTALPDSAGIVGIAAAVAASLLLFPPAFSGKLLSFAVTPRITEAFGNGHWRSALYAGWDSIFSVGITVALIVLFRRTVNRPSRIGTFLAQHSYAVYLLHVPIVVYVSYLIRGIGLTAIPKFGVATAIITPICFLVAWLIRNLPGTKRIL